MWISKAFAAADENAIALDSLPDAPSQGDAFMLNMGLIGILVVLFYVLLIMPQQRRFKEHAKMLEQLKKGDKIVTAGGLVGKVDSLPNDKEVIVDLGGGVKVTALRSMIQTKEEISSTTANDDAKQAKAKTPAKPKSDKEPKKK